MVAPTNTEKRNIAREISDGYPWWEVVGGLVGGVMSFAIPAVGPLGIVVMALGFVVGAAIGHGGKYLHAYFISAPRIWYQKRIEELEQENAELSRALMLNLDYESEKAAEQVGELWHEVQQAMDGFFKKTSVKWRTLGNICDLAVWPDMLLVAQLDSPPTKGAIAGDLLNSIARYVYPEAGYEGIPQGRFLAFDNIRRRVSRRYQRWATHVRERDADGELSQWLLAKMKPTHERTLKLVWYLEVANASRIDNKKPDYAPFVELRDVFAGGKQAVPRIELRTTPGTAEGA